MVTRHQFLHKLHLHLKPRGYLEIGVHTGDSLRLASEDTESVGVDPYPQVGPLPPNKFVYAMTSDTYFTKYKAPGPEFIDLAFIDGMHLFEFALRDFMNIEANSNPRTVVAFDDVLPRNQGEAAREQCPGDWTGDVWKVYNILDTYRPDLRKVLVDTSPTGILLVWNLDPENRALHDRYETLENAFRLDQWNLVPDAILSRAQAVSPQEALERIKGWQCGWQSQAARGSSELP